MPGYYMPNHRNQVDIYLAQKVMTASPEQLISYIFDIGITACKTEDRLKASKAVQELINALDFDNHRAVATNFFQNYRYILNLVQKGKFELACQTLHELKKTWVEAMKVI